MGELEKYINHLIIQQVGIRKVGARPLAIHSSCLFVVRFASRSPPYPTMPPPMPAYSVIARASRGLVKTRHGKVPILMTAGIPCTSWYIVVGVVLLMVVQSVVWNIERAVWLSFLPPSLLSVSCYAVSYSLRSLRSASA